MSIRLRLSIRQHTSPTTKVFEFTSLLCWIAVLHQVPAFITKEDERKQGDADRLHSAAEHWRLRLLSLVMREWRGAPYGLDTHRTAGLYL